MWGITGSLLLVLAVYRALSLLLSMASIVLCMGRGGPQAMCEFSGGVS